MTFLSPSVICCEFLRIVDMGIPAKVFTRSATITIPTRQFTVTVDMEPNESMDSVSDKLKRASESAVRELAQSKFTKCVPLPLPADLKAAASNNTVERSGLSARAILMRTTGDQMSVRLDIAFA